MTETAPGRVRSARKKAIRARVFDGVVPREILVTGGQFCRTLRELVAAGPRGITPLEAGGWARRLAHYVHILKKRHGLPILTTTEKHGDPATGDFGYHGRYLLKCRVEILPDETPAANEAAA